MWQSIGRVAEQHRQGADEEESTVRVRLATRAELLLLLFPLSATELHTGSCCFGKVTLHGETAFFEVKFFRRRPAIVRKPDTEELYEENHGDFRSVLLFCFKM